MQSSTLTESTTATGFDLPIESRVLHLARRGLNWSFVLLPGRYLLSMASSAVLSRLLSPGDYGMLGMVATITVLGQAVSDLGLSWATVQRERLDRNQIDALFFLNAAFGFVLTGLCLASAHYVAGFYRRPELTNIMIAVSGTLFLSSLAAQPTALLIRRMKIREINLSSLCSLVISATVAVILAKLGFGYWALVAQLVVQQSVTTALAFPLSGYCPRIPLHLLHMGTLLKFGGYSAAYGIVNYFARNLDNVLVGKFWGATALGYYSRAYFLMTLPGMLVIGAFSGVVIPALAALRKEPARMQSAYLRALRWISVLGGALAVGLAVTAPEIVDFVYGPKWHPVVPILLWLSAASILQPIQNTAQWLYIVAGRGKGMFLMGLIVAGSATLAFAAGIRSGPIGVARAYAIANTVIAYPVLAMAHRACGLEIRKAVAVTAPLLLCALLMGVAVYLVGTVCRITGASLHARLALKVIVGVAVYAASLKVLAYPTYSELLGYLPARLRA
jgi:PST family polysaccharide transporter